MKHTISVIVDNKPGVLSRVAGLFSRRNFNIESLAVGTTEDPSISRMTIVAAGDDKTLEQIIKQLYKLINVIRVFDIPKDNAAERHLMLVKVKFSEKTRPEIIEVVDIFQGKIIHVGINSMIIEVTGDEEKIAGIEKLLNKFGIIELVRTGKIALKKETEQD